MPGHSNVTLCTETIHNPNEPRHFMRLKPAGRSVTVHWNGHLLASTSNALRCLEVGKDLYDPVLYIPWDDVRAPLTQRTDVSTHCPVKGDAVYFDLMEDTGGALIDKIGWSYPDPVKDAGDLAGRIAFDTSKVTIVEAPLPD